MKKEESIKAGKEKALGAIGEFKKFISQGNVMDMAVGVIMGGAFGKIVTSLVNDMLMPIVGLLLGKVDFSALSFNGIKYGAFIQSIVDFLIVAVCIFAMVKILEKFKRKDYSGYVVEYDSENEEEIDSCLSDMFGVEIEYYH